MYSQLQNIQMLFYNEDFIGIEIVVTRDETIWRYIDTVSIRRLTIRIVAQRDISRYDLDICIQGKSPRCLYFFVFDECFVIVQEI